MIIFIPLGLGIPIYLICKLLIFFGADEKEIWILFKYSFWLCFIGNYLIMTYNNLKIFKH